MKPVDDSDYIVDAEPLLADEALRCGKTYDAKRSETETTTETCLRAKDHTHGCSSLNNGEIVAYLRPKLIIEPGTMEGVAVIEKEIREGRRSAKDLN